MNAPTLATASLVLMFLVPAADGSHASLAAVATLPCDLAADALAPSGSDLDAPRWRFRFVGQEGGSLDTYELDLESDRRTMLPEGYYEFLGDEFSHLRGQLRTDAGSWPVDVVWRLPPGEAARHLFEAQLVTQQYLAMHLEGMTARDGGAPILLDVLLAGAPLVCWADAHAFNWLDYCFSTAFDETEVCAPGGYFVTGGLDVYYNGPASYTGTISAAPTRGAGTAHGSTDLLGFFAFVPPVTPPIP